MGMACFLATSKLMSRNLSGKRPGERGRGAAGRTPVFGTLQRDGNVHAGTVPNVQRKTREPIILRHGERFGGGRAIIKLGTSGRPRGAVHVVKKGAEDNTLHVHTGMDGFNMALKGEAPFYAPDDAVTGVFAEQQGLTMPHGNAYWFANTGNGDLEPVLVVTWMPGIDDKRTDANPPKAM